MANNFFGKLRGLVSSAWAEADVQPTHITPAPAASAQNVGNLSSVERYLAKQAAAQAASEPKALTGVERYLAKYVEVTQPAETSKAPLTSVEKYLARQAGTPKIEPAKPAAPLSKVDKYLASQSPAPAKAAVTPAKKADAPAKNAPTAKKKTDITEKAAVAPEKETPAATPKAAAPAAKESVSAIDLTAGATQCQANTSKGTQCRNTLRLNQLQLEINGKTYVFAACNQHNNSAFKPFQSV
jgi:hypothetical protein